MPICEECKKEVARRVTYRRADECKKVCKECEEKLSTESYVALCNCIMNMRQKD